MKMRRTKIILIVLAVILTATAVIGTASAYFTTHSSAAGSVAVSISPIITTNDEEVDPDGMVKVITINNEGETPCYVRVIAFAPSEMTLSYDGSGWSENGDYVDYEAVLEAGESTEPLTITIGNVPEEAEEGYTFNVIVAYETTYVTYDDEGQPEAPDWDREISGYEGGQN